MIKSLAILAVFAAAACGQPQPEQPTGQPAGNALAGGGNVDANAAVSSPIAGAAPGQQLRALRDAPCAEVGPGASDEPWNVKKGSVGNLVRIEGATTLIDTGSGLPCRIATDALEPA